MKTIFRFLLLTVLFFNFKNVRAQVTANTILDINGGIKAGNISATNTEFDTGTLANIFDGDTNSLARTKNINPLVVTLAFKYPTTILGAKFFCSYENSGTWSLESANTQNDLINKTGSYKVWANARPLTGIGNPPHMNDSVGGAATAIQYLRLTSHKIGDDFVHANELLIYSTGSYSSMKFESSSLDLYKDWYFIPKVLVSSTTQQAILKSSLLTYTSSNPAVATVDATGKIKYISIGNATITGTYKTLKATLSVQCKSGMIAEQHITNFDPFLSTPAPCSVKQIPVVVIIYLPTKDGLNLDTSEIGRDYIATLDAAKTKLQKQSDQTKYMLEEGSKFHGYKDPSALPYLGYKIIDYIIVYEPLPNSYHGPGKAVADYYADFNLILNRYNAKHYVEDLGVKQFWLYGYQYNKIAPAESNMASALSGNVSNSDRKKDMPVFSKSYTLYNYNLTVGANENVHDHGHQLEALYGYINNDLFNTKFVAGEPTQGRCGDTHFAVNSTFNGDYRNFTPKTSDIEDWQPAGGPTKQISAANWGRIKYTFPNNNDFSTDSNAIFQAHWYIYWRQNMPGMGNKVPNGSGGFMSNWWQFTSDWDSCVKNNLNLYVSAASQITYKPGCQLSKAPTLTISPAGGNYSGSVNVTLTATDSQDPNPVIYYTLDGSTPGTYSRSFMKQGVITISSSMTLKAFAKNNINISSTVQSQTYTIAKMLTFWFRRPSYVQAPRIHYWNVVPSQPGTTWPGVLMAQDLSKGPDWYKYSIPNATSASLVFYDGQYFKTADQLNRTSGCFDGNNYSWVSCGWAVPSLNLVTSVVDASDPINSLSLFPNPSSGSFEFEYKTENKSIELKIMDVLGKEVFNEVVSSEGGLVHKSFSLNYPQGIYTITVKDGASINSKRLVIQ
jgi:hypothetical protein